MNINYLVGDATNPVGQGRKIICHICNDIGAWGAGFVLAISKKWLEPQNKYRTLWKRPLFKTEMDKLGSIQIVRVEQDIEVANMIGQHDIKPDSNGRPPIRYAAVKQCLTKVNEYAVQHNATLHMPRIGCGLAGGDWKTIEAIIKEVVTVDVYVYDLK